jgi:hypothetical protein
VVVAVLLEALVPVTVVAVEAPPLVEGESGHCGRKIAMSAEHTEWFCLATIARHSLA